jgi:hypothetical protein
LVVCGAYGGVNLSTRYRAARGKSTIGGPPLPRALDLADYVAFLVLGLSGLVANTTVWYLGLKHTTDLNAGIVGAASPIFVAVAASMRFEVNRGDLLILASQSAWVVYSLYSHAAASTLPRCG